MRNIWDTGYSDHIVYFISLREIFLDGNSEVERTPFITHNEPVRLTPAWEESNLPNDELNFKGEMWEKFDLCSFVSLVVNT